MRSMRAIASTPTSAPKTTRPPRRSGSVLAHARNTGGHLTGGGQGATMIGPLGGGGVMTRPGPAAGGCGQPGSGAAGPPGPGGGGGAAPGGRAAAGGGPGGGPAAPPRG